MARSEPLVLVVEDDPPMLRFISRTLEVNDLTVAVAADGPMALQMFRAKRPDLVVLDIGIPGLDGLEVCRLMKRIHQTPVIMVTARGTDEDVVHGFEVGAEDYLSKPFAGSVLVARVKALLRRAQVWDGLPGDLMECGDLVVDFSARRITRGGHIVHLTPTEYKLLTVLSRHRGRVLTSNQIITDVWGEPLQGDAQALRTHIGRLRKKIEPDRGRPVHVRTEPGVGYWLSCPHPER